MSVDPIIPLQSDVPYDRDRELAFWMLPTSVDLPNDGGRNWAIDRLARRYLRYVHQATFPMGEPDLARAFDRLASLQRRLERVIVRDRLRGYEGEALDLVLARAQMIIDPDRFGCEPGRRF